MANGECDGVGEALIASCYRPILCYGERATPLPPRGHICRVEYDCPDGMVHVSRRTRLLVPFARCPWMRLKADGQIIHT